MYSLMWEPPVPGKYTIIATFEGSAAYYGSVAETAMGIIEVSSPQPAEPEPTEPAPTEPEPTEPEAPAPAQSIEPEPAEPEPTEPTAEAPVITTDLAIIIAVVIVAVIGIVAYWTLRKRK